MPHPKTRAETRPWVRSPTAWAVAGGIVSLGLALVRFDPYLFTGGDNAVYYSLAHALANGAGYVSLYTGGTPPHVLYPPGFPVLLVPFYLLSGGSMVAMKLAVLLAGGLLLWATWRLAREDAAVPAWAAAAAVWTVGLYPVFQDYSHRLMSDLPFTAFVLASLAVFQRATAPQDAGDTVDRRWLVGCGLALVAFWIRVPGVTLLAAIVVWAVLHRQWRRAGASAVIFAAGTLPWFAWSRIRAAAEGAGGEYLGQVAGITEGDAAAEIQSNTTAALTEYGLYQFPHLFWPTDPIPFGVPVVTLVLGSLALAWGAWRAIRARGLQPWEVYVPATLAILPFWPWLGDRFFLTVAPLLWLWILVGLGDVSRRIYRGPAAAIGLVALVCGCLLFNPIKGIPKRLALTRAWIAGDRLQGYDLFWHDYFEAAWWMRTNTPEDAVVAARKPSLVWYWSRRPVVVEAVRWDVRDRWAMMGRRGVTHILLESYSEDRLAKTLAEHREAVQVVYQTESGQVVVLAVQADAR